MVLRVSVRVSCLYKGEPELEDTLDRNGINAHYKNDPY